MRRIKRACCSGVSPNAATSSPDSNRWPPSTAMFPYDISCKSTMLSCWPTTVMFPPRVRQGGILSASIISISPLSSKPKRYRFFDFDWESPMMTTVTPALWLPKLHHFNKLYPKPKRYRFFDFDWESPMMTTVTPALWLARLAHLNEVCAKRMTEPVARIFGQSMGTMRPWHIELVLTNAASAVVCCAYSAAFMNHPPT